ncbi:MAG: tetratricopeptide repeat protein, partial [Thermomicrobiaceae bacterium]|nr:tetratricopeptide repeat protein [Thermomicrobiaceae bacterium]
LGNLQFNLGRADDAGQSYATACQTVPDYPAGLAGQARLAAASGDLARAADLYRRAFDRMPLPEYAIALGDVYARFGDQQQARDTYDLVQAIDHLFQANGVNTDLEIALFYADHDRDLPTAVARARAAYAARPSVHAADALAWSLYKAGQYQEAGKYADEALRLGTRDPLKLFHAGMIANALGQRDRARADLQQVVDLNPHFSLLYQDVAAATLASLGGTVPTASGGGS